VLGAFFEAVLKGFRGASSQDLPALRKNLQALLRGNNQLLEAARNEPSSPAGAKA